MQEILDAVIKNLRICRFLLLLQFWQSTNKTIKAWWGCQFLWIIQTEQGTTDVDKPYINMHPQIVSMADVCDGTERIKGSINRGACCRIHIEWNQTLERENWGWLLHTVCDCIIGIINYNASGWKGFTAELKI